MWAQFSWQMQLAFFLNKYPIAVIEDATKWKTHHHYKSYSCDEGRCGARVRDQASVAVGLSTRFWKFCSQISGYHEQDPPFQPDFGSCSAKCRAIFCQMSGHIKPRLGTIPRKIRNDIQLDLGPLPSGSRENYIHTPNCLQHKTTRPLNSLLATAQSKDDKGVDVATCFHRCSPAGSSESTQDPLDTATSYTTC